MTGRLNIVKSIGKTHIIEYNLPQNFVIVNVSCFIDCYINYMLQENGDN